MADIVVDGRARVVFVPTIANTAAPTVAELTAGTYLGNVLVAGGLEGFEASTSEVDNTAFDSRFGTKSPGTSDYSGTRMIFKKQSGTDTVWELMTEFGTSGYVVIRDGKDAQDPYVATDKVNVYPIMTGDWDYMNRERNSVLRYWVATPIVSEPVKPATVAA